MSREHLKGSSYRFTCPPEPHIFHCSLGFLVRTGKALGGWRGGGGGGGAGDWGKNLSVPCIPWGSRKVPDSCAEGISKIEAIQGKTVLSSKPVNAQPTFILHCGNYACSTLLLGPQLLLEINHLFITSPQTDANSPAALLLPRVNLAFIN